MTLDSQPFAGQVAVVTGGGTGLGRGISERLADLGAAVMVGQRTAATASDAAAALATPGRTIATFAADLATSAGCADLVTAAIARFGRVDILVNNAAVTGPPALVPFGQCDDESLDQIVDLNLKAAFRCARHAVANMRTRRSGVIVNITSVAAFAAQLRASAYVATKAALVGLTKALALELADVGIRVVGVAPGDIDISPVGESGSVPAPPSQWWVRHTPIGRRGQPADVAFAVEFLCSEQASFITGTTLVVDGGWLTY